MDDFLSIIGTVASVGSIPLSVYLYIKSQENNIDKVKREIVRILSHQIGDRRTLTTFEIQTVINSKTRENKVSSSKVTANQITEDLVAETISNPLLDKGVKESIIKELRNIYFKGKVLLTLDNLELETRAGENSDNIEDEIKKLIESRKDLENDFKSVIDEELSIKLSASKFFGVLAICFTLIVTIISILGKGKYDNFNKPIEEFLKNNEFYITIGISAFIALISGIATFIGWKTKNTD